MATRRCVRVDSWLWVVLFFVAFGFQFGFLSVRVVVQDTFHGCKLVLDSSGGAACGPINQRAARDLGQVISRTRIALSDMHTYAARV